MNKQSKNFELWPAIDLIDGMPVRLTKGDFELKTEYDLPIASIINQFETFASGIHIIDLDGARTGSIKNSATIETIINAASLPIQLGGGIRTINAVEQWLSMNINRLIIGTKALTDPSLLQSATKQYGTDKIVISVDIKQNKVMTNGWKDSNNVDIFNFIEKLLESGFKNYMVTDIERDGTLEGASVDLYYQLKNTFPEIYVLAAGGIGKINDLIELRETGINGAIFGKAFYEKNISLTELMEFNNAR